MKFILSFVCLLFLLTEFSLNEEIKSNNNSTNPIIITEGGKDQVETNQEINSNLKSLTKPNSETEHPTETHSNKTHVDDPHPSEAAHPKEVNATETHLIKIPVEDTHPNQIHAANKKQQIIQIQQQQKYLQSLNQPIPKWVREQYKESSNANIELPITQTFSFILESQQDVFFKWNPSKEKQLKIIVNVFHLTDNGDLTISQKSQQNQYVEIMDKNPQSVFFREIGKVYRTKIFTVNFDTDYKLLKLLNTYSERVFIQIDVEKLVFVVSKGVADNLLSTARIKMDEIIMQSQSTQIRREHIYKWQWGFLDNEKNHQVKVLGLTGVELFAIILTACVQMYFLKGLLDNRAIV